MGKGGLSLLELLGVLAVLAVLLALGLPWLSPNGLALDQAAQTLAAQVTRARLEAIRRNAFVGLDVLRQGAGGYLLFVDENGNRRPDPGEAFQEVRFGEGPWARVRLDLAQSHLGNLPLLFDPRGTPYGLTTATFALSSGSASRKVVVSQQGRARVE
ncbi:GspH/FimT family protein [Thermus thalpophilus]|uniref:GspH/FimT family protein n=1 Tax=Thermus thalpophilus TaxID=2908147 RepID=UPI001FAAD1AD|nr:GspH/FimT family protein [Thermus thalpophilus]